MTRLAIAVRRNAVRGLLALLLLSSIWPVVRPSSDGAGHAGKVAPALARILATDSRPQRVWVFFLDKGFESAAERAAAIEALGAGYDERAVERRRRRGTVVGFGSASPFDVQDLPLADAYVAAVEQTGARARIRSRWLNALSVVATTEQIRKIVDLPFVTRVQLVARALPPEPVDVAPAGPPPRASSARGLDYGRSTVQLEQIDLIALHQAGFTGEGVVIGILDTGFRRDHVAFHQPGHELQVIAEYDFVDGDPDASNQPGDPSSQHNHGTMILGTIAAYHPGELVGGAFDASVILCKTEDTTDEYQGEEDNYIAGLEFIEAHGGDLATSSLGYIDWYTQADLDGQTAVTTLAVNAATARGLHCLTAAGNESHDSNPATSHLIAPADALEVITIGAVTSSGTISSFSSDGPTADGRVKPEVLALGSSTQTISPSSSTSYTTASGTSLATPLAAAAVACLVEARPAWSVQTLRERLFREADWDPGGLGFDPTYVRGYGILDAYLTHANASGLIVSPAADLVSEGPQGGPFVPPEITYALGNNDAAPLDYAVAPDAGWVEAGSTAGTIPAASSVAVTVGIGAPATSFGPGRYESTVDFINTGTHEGDTSRGIVLWVDRTIVEVFPASGAAFTGAVGGPFSGGASYVVTSKRPAPVAVEVHGDVPWLLLDGLAAPLRFTLSGTGSSRSIAVGLSPAAAVLAAGTYGATLTFTNSTSGEGSTTRAVSLVVGGPQPVYQEPFDVDPGWTRTGQWQFGIPSGAGSHARDPLSGHTGTRVYGYNLSGDYPNNMGQEFLTSTPFDCSAMSSVGLRFWRWLGVESPSYDHVSIQARGDGAVWTTVWSNASAGGAISESAWSEQNVDLSAVADGRPALQLRWVMGTTDVSVTYPGWNLDDVELRGVVPSERVTLLLDRAELRWTPLPAALAFDVVWGDLDLLRSTGGDFAVATQGCLADQTSASFLSHAAVPASAGGRWFLVRGVGASGPMTYGSPDGSEAAPRDPGIAAAPGSCP